MRVRHIKSLQHMIHAGQTLLAEEYRSISTVVDHEFRDETERGRYVALLRAYGLFAYGDRFATVLVEGTEPVLPADRSEPVKPVCSHCGGDSLARDASVRWDADAQDWQISGIYDCTFCDDCSAEGDSLCQWVPLERRGVRRDQTGDDRSTRPAP